MGSKIKTKESNDGHKKYWAGFRKKFPIWDQLIYSVVFSAFSFAVYSGSLTLLRDKRLRLISFVLVIVLISLLFAKWQPRRRFKAPFLNQIDQAAFIVTCSVILDIPILLILHATLIIDISLVAVIVVLYAVFVFFRSRLIYERSRAQSETQLLDLKDICYPTKGKYDLTKAFLVKETEVDYDLLSRDSLIQDLQSTINRYDSSDRFVIGIEGPWGSGKSTLIKNVVDGVDKNQVIIVDDFEPWIYTDQISLVDDLFRKIFSQDSLRLSSQQIKAVTNLALSLMFGDKGNGLLDHLFSNNRDKSSELNNYFEDINIVLDRDNKKILLIIDNLDRIEAENVFLILNLVNNVLNLKRMLVVLLYDKEQLEHSLQTIGINPGYLNKIVQKKISIPIRSKEYLSAIYTLALTNIAVANGIAFDTKNIEAAEIISFLAENFDLREFKRFVNSSVVPYLTDKRLFFPDYLVVEIIKFRDFSIYEQIYQQRNYFISSDFSQDISFYTTGEKKIQEKYQNFFNVFFKAPDQGKYLELLAICFPNAAVFRDGQTGLQREYTYRSLGPNPRPDIMRNKRMMSANFFDAYFNTNSDPMIDVMDFAERLVPDAERPNDLNTSFQQLSKKSLSFQKDLLTGLNFVVGNLKPEDALILIREFLDLYLLPTRYLPADFLFKNAIARTTGEICQRLDLPDFKQIMVEYCLRDPKYLSLVYELINDLQNAFPGYSDRDLDLKNKLDFLKTEFQKFLNSIYDEQDVNLYDRSTYSFANIYSMSRFLYKADPVHFSDAPSIIKTYVDSHMNTENAYRVLNDMIREYRTVAGGVKVYYKYGMTDNYDKFVNVTQLSLLLEKNSPKNDKQSFIKSVFDVRNKKDKTILSNDSIALDTIDG
ncbi:MAG: P-loop NTPase fold protein [Oenococcus sp.]|uniref:KAP family P-loop NTPase fold protein n=1 Tax=Oenococcus sp. TaxID=1979414 RepID=UPI0039E97E2F